VLKKEEKKSDEGKLSERKDRKRESSINRK
jgi:hypothetical protein